MRRKKKKVTFAMIAFAAIVLVFEHYIENPSLTLQTDQTSSVKQEANLPFLQEEMTVTDGDTIRIGERRIRLWGIDAPELHQKCFKDKQEVACGKDARLALVEILGSGALNCEIVDIDRYKREVSRCMVGNKDIAEWMVRIGWAFDYTEYSKGFYKELEEKSKAEKQGIWALKFDKPADWRKGNRRYR